MSTLSTITRARWPRGAIPAATGRLVVFGSVDLGCWLARRFIGARVDVFVRSWSEVDLGRQRAAAEGLDGRLSVHHLAAADLVLVSTFERIGASAA